MLPWWSFTLILATVGLPFLLDYRDWTNWDRKNVLKVAPGPCKAVIEDGGSEDLLHLGNNKILITQGFNFEWIVGQISILDLNTNNAFKANITNAPKRSDFLTAPHGVTSWKDPDTGELLVYVVTHVAAEDRVEVFEVTNSLTLNYLRTIKDSSFTFMNDLVAVGRDKFYITGTFRYRAKARVTAESYLRMRNGRIVYYDGRYGREVASGYLMANGINISPDLKTVYMAECGYKKVHAFRRDESNNLHQLWEYDTQTIVDNIDVDPATGDLWIGCHPILWKILDFYNYIFNVIPPSQVIRIKLRDNMVSEVEEIYSDNGDEILASTVAAYVNGKLIIGSLASTTLVCDVNYLSP